MTVLKGRIKRLVNVQGLGPMVVLIDAGGVAMRRPKERDTSAYELPWLRVHGQAARLRAEEKKRERAKKRAEQRGLRSLR